MDDDKFVEIHSNCDAGDDRFVELRGNLVPCTKKYRFLAQFFIAG